MSIVTLFEYPRKLIVAKPLLNIIGNIKSGKYADSVDRLRDIYHSKLDTLFDVQKRHIPVFTIAGNFNFSGPVAGLRVFARSSGSNGFDDLFVNNLEIKAVPEPMTMFTFGLGIMLFPRRRR